MSADHLVVPETWSEELKDASRTGGVRVVPFEVTIGYDMWSYRKNYQVPRSFFVPLVTLALLYDVGLALLTTALHS